jgi:serine/threonine protein kinase
LLLEGCYRVIQPLGGGGFGKTYEIDDCGTPKILKVLHNTHPKAVELFQQEAQVLSRLHHPGIPKVEADGYFTYIPRNSTTPLHCLVMEKIEGMNLAEWMTQANCQPIGERAALRWLKQLVIILQEVHQRNYFHRDIKPANVMLRSDGQLTLIDFGTAREVTQTYFQKIAGQQVTGINSCGYTPPEQINGKAVPQSDFYALGRTFVYLLTSREPIEFAEEPRTGKLIWRDSATQISPTLADFIDYLMAPFPGNRPKDTLGILQCLTVIDPSFSQPQQSSQPAQPPNSGATTPPAPAPNSPKSWRRILGFPVAIIKWVIALPIVLVRWVWQSLADSSDRAGVARRFFAYLIDLILVSPWVIFWLAIINNFNYQYVYIPELSSGGYIQNTGVIIISIPLMIIGVWLYFTLLESSQNQATIGKRLLKIVVTDTRGGRIKFWRSNWRFLWKVGFTISIAIGIGLIDFIVAGFTKKRQALHDIIAGTIVVKKKP